MSQYFPKPYEPFGGDINVKVDLSNYAAKADIKNISHVDTSSFALKTNLANLKTEVDKLDIDKLVPVPVDLSKLSDVVKNDVVKKTDYNAKITEIENKIPDISNLASKTALNTVENEIPDTSGYIKKTDYNAKITDLENKIPDISNLATKTALNTAENKIPNGSGLASKIALTAIENKIPDNSLLPSINYISNTDKIRVKFTVTCLKQLNKLTYTHKKVVNIYIVYELGAPSYSNSDPTLKNCLYGAVTLKKNTDIEKYG